MIRLCVTIGTTNQITSITYYAETNKEQIKVLDQWF
jgi:hypothetical protein